MARIAWAGLAVVLAAVVVMCLVMVAGAGIPERINYQGRLTDRVTGFPLAGSHSLTLRIFDAELAGNLLWSETKAETADSTGVFTTILGSVNGINVAFDGPCWLEVEVDGEVLSPRREMVSVPYSFRANSADHAVGSDSLGGHSADRFVLKGEAGSVTASMIVGGAGSGLDADKVDGEHANAFADTAHNHDGRYYTKTDLSTPGVINQGDNPVDWTELKGVPPGFADGVDNTGAADGYSLDAADGSPTDVVYVDNDGKVRIGLVSPVVAKLEVTAGPSQDAIRSTTNAGVGSYGYSISGTGVVGGSDTGTGVMGVSNTGKAGAFAGDVYVSGRLGIGNASPEEKLDVDGDVNLSGSLRLGGYTVLADVFDARTLKVGFFAAPNDTDLSNTAVGNYAGYKATGGIGNTMIGNRAGTNMTNADGNTFVGSDAGLGVNTGSLNTYVGQGAGSFNHNGRENTYVGRDAGALGSSGSNNTFLGMEAGFTNEGIGNIFLGYRAGRDETGSNKFYVANGLDTSNVLIYGDFSTGRIGLGTLSPERKLHIVGDGPRVLVEASTGNPEVNFKLAGDPTSEVWAIYKSSVTEDLRFYQNGDRVTLQAATGNVAIGTTDPAGYRLYVNGSAYATGGWQPSDLRLKADLAGIDGALGKVLQLEGVSFRWRTEDQPGRGFPGGRHYGLVAQEVEKVLPEIVGSGPGDEKALAYTELIPVLVEAVKELKAESDELRAENQSLRQRLEALESRSSR